MVKEHVQGIDNDDNDNGITVWYANDSDSEDASIPGLKVDSDSDDDTDNALLCDRE